MFSFPNLSSYLNLETNNAPFFLRHVYNMKGINPGNWTAALNVHTVVDQQHSMTWTCTPENK